MGQDVRKPGLGGPGVFRDPFIGPWAPKSVVTVKGFGDLFIGPWAPKSVDNHKALLRKRTTVLANVPTFKPHVQAWLSWSEQGTVNL